MKHTVTIFLLYLYSLTAFGQSENFSLSIINCQSDSTIYKDFLLDLDSLGVLRMQIPTSELPSWVVINDTGDINIDTSKIKRPKSLPTRKVKGFDLEVQHQTAIQKSDFCAFKLYVAAFDRLLSSGLDPYSYIDYSTQTVVKKNGQDKTNSYWRTEEEINEERLIRNYLAIKVHYDKHILNVFFKHKESKEFISIVDNFIRYGIYKYPKILRSILLGEI